VQNTLIKVHRLYFCRDSEAFCKMITFEASENKEEGLSDEKPIKLEDQDLTEIECFLSLFYPE
jgi:hypothetical protein